MWVCDNLKHDFFFAEGSSLYLVNCTSDSHLCDRIGVRGFPSVCAFRGLGWLRGDRCLSMEAGLRAEPVKMDYHGVMQVKVQHGPLFIILVYILCIN